MRVSEAVSSRMSRLKAFVGRVMALVFKSLFAKYMMTFVGIMMVSNVIATGMMYLYYGVDWRLARLMVVTPRAPRITQFALSMGLTTIAVSAICIFVAVRLLVRPIRNISEASKRVAQGDFNARVQVKGHDEMTELAKNFNTMTEALSQNELLHKDFVSNVSHEFKTPLTSMRGYAKLLKKEGLPEEKRQAYLDILIAETERLAQLSSSLLKLSELEHDRMVLHKAPFSLDEQLRDVLVLLQAAWEQRALEIDLDLAPVTFVGDQELLYQVWINIVGNAIKFSRDGGRLSVRLLQLQDGVQVEIEDTGAGMSEAVQARIFDRFYKGDASRGSGGTGLGLAISKRIVELHGGEIRVSSVEGRGSCFRVFLGACS